MNKEQIEQSLKSGLVLWAGKHDVTPKAFAMRMDYQYTTAWSILRGKNPFTVDAFGRFCLAYGLLAGTEVVELAKLVEEKYDVTALGGLDEGAVVPLLTISSGAKPSKAPKVNRRKMTAEQAA
jgi:hypothetical protein